MNALKALKTHVSNLTNPEFYKLKIAAPPPPEPYPDYWMKDSESNICLNCQSVFSMLNRRNHCRACGKLFCDKCVSRRRAVPLRGYLDKQPVCDLCDALEKQRIDYEEKHLKRMLTGEVFTKYPNGRGFVRKKFLQMTNDGKTLTYQNPDNKTKPPAKIYMLDIQKIEAGHKTPAFEKARKPGPSECCFSIITNDRTYDFEASSQDIRENWVIALREGIAVLAVADKNAQIDDAKLNEERMAQLRAESKIDARRMERHAKAERAVSEKMQGKPNSPMSVGAATSEPSASASASAAASAPAAAGRDSGVAASGSRSSLSVSKR